MKLDRIIGALAFITFLFGVHLEQYLWDEMMMESPTELTVTDFEIAEEGLSVVLTNAIEDQRAVVEHMAKERDEAHRAWFNATDEGMAPNDSDVLAEITEEYGRLQFQAMRVLGLLEATRDREAGQLA